MASAVCPPAEWRLAGRPPHQFLHRGVILRTHALGAHEGRSRSWAQRAKDLLLAQPQSLQTTSAPSLFVEPGEETSRHNRCETIPSIRIFTGAHSTRGGIRIGQYSSVACPSAEACSSPDPGAAWHDSPHAESASSGRSGFPLLENPR